MSLLNPTLLIAASAIAIPALLILYFLKLRRRDVEISTTILWKKAIEDLQANAPFQKLRRNILLLLQLLALAAALFSLGQPEIQANLTKGARHVILIDRSASMKSTDGNAKDPLDRATRLDAAKKEALALIDTLKEPGLFGAEGDQAMVIAYDTVASTIQHFTANKVELRRAVESITPTDSPTSIRLAFDLTRANAPKRTFMDKAPDGSQVLRDLGPGPIGNIHIFSDGLIPDLAQMETDPDDSVFYHSQGSTNSWNVGITGLRADRQYDQPGKLAVFIGLQSTRPAPATIEIELSIEGLRKAVREITLPAAKIAEQPANPGEDKGGAQKPERIVTPASGGIIFPIDWTEGGLVTIAIRPPPPAEGDRGDVLPADDIGYISVPPAKRLAVAMISDGNLFLREVLEGLSLSRPPLIIPTTGGDAFLTSKEAAEFDVVILDRWLPTAASTAADAKPVPTLPNGRFMVFGAVPPIGLLDKGPGSDTVALTWQRDHPVLRNVGFDSLSIAPDRSVEVRRDTGATIVGVLAEGQHGPLLVEIADTSRRALVATFDLLNSNWALSPGFVVYVVKGLEYLARDGNEAAATMLRPGDTLKQRLPRGATDASLSLPDKARRELVIDADGSVTFGPVEQVGIYTVSWNGPLGATDVQVNNRARRAVAANLTDPAESSISTRANLPLAAKVIPALAEEHAKGTRRLWPWFLLAAAAVMMLEWWVYNRKVSL